VESMDASVESKTGSSVSDSDSSSSAIPVKGAGRRVVAGRRNEFMIRICSSMVKVKLADRNDHIVDSKEVNFRKYADFARLRANRVLGLNGMG
jgi:hypothetical protein